MANFVFVQYEGSDVGTIEALSRLLGNQEPDSGEVEVREFRAYTQLGFQPNPVIEPEEDEDQEDEDEDDG